MKKRQRSQWDLPGLPLPEGDRCFMIHIPDDPKVIAAFKGALYDLAKPYAWGDDDAHSALDVGARMSDAYATIQEIDCENTMLLRACTLDCGIEYSTDGGDTWTCISLANCIGDLVGSGISQAIEDGLLQRAGGQPDPTSPPSPGQCSTYHVVLRANERWKIPSPMNMGDSISINNVRGGWTDGAFLWYCYDGKSFVLGTCGNNNPYQASDPLHSGNHMMLIGGYNTTTPTYFAALSGYIFPSGVVNQEAWLQANDSVISDNSGQIEFDVTVCSGAQWCFTIDFKLTDGGFTVVTGERGQWVSGSGWEGRFYSSTSNPEVIINRTLTAGFYSKLEMIYDTTGGGSQSSMAIELTMSGTQVGRVGVSNPGSGTDKVLILNVANVQADKIRLGVNNGPNGGTNRITRLTCWGVGANPFGTNNC